MSLENLFQQFIQHGRYLRNWSPRTVHTYQQGFASFQQSLGGSRLNCAGHTVVAKAQLEAWLIWMRRRGLTPGGCNMYIRTLNSLCSWLHAEGHLTSPIRLKLLPNPPKAVRSFSDAEMRALMAYRPKGASEVRTWTLVLCLMDTGLRIEEALGLEQRNVDSDNLMLKVLGKGNKERVVPFSLELRKHLCLQAMSETSAVQ